jgi:hypothetical protein
MTHSIFVVIAVLQVSNTFIPVVTTLSALGRGEGRGIRECGWSVSFEKCKPYPVLCQGQEGGS